MERVIEYILSVLDRNLSMSQDQREVTEYALYNVLITLCTLLGVLLIGGLLGVLPEAVAALMTGAVFRWSTGGAHLSKPGRCVAVSVSVPLGIALVSGWIGMRYVVAIHRAILILVPVTALLLLALIVIRTYAPAETENKPIPPSERPKLRVWAYVTLAAWAILMYFLYAEGHFSLLVASCLGLTWQMVSVTPVGYRIFPSIDAAFSVLERFFERGN